jgi:NitT/TauT family transport system substrate-binding protein
MRKKFKILTASLILITTAIFIIGCSGGKTANEGKVKVRLNEVTRSVFYAPMYVAMSQGFFEENGIEIDLQTGQAP